VSPELRAFLASWWFVALALLAPLSAWVLVGIYGKFESEEDREGWFRASVMGLMLFAAFLIPKVIH
jgi:hypothetical protein